MLGAGSAREKEKATDGGKKERGGEEQREDEKRLFGETRGLAAGSPRVAASLDSRLVPNAAGPSAIARFTMQGVAR